MTLPAGKYSADELAFFKRIFDQFYDGVRNYIYYKTSDIDLAEDIVQDVFLKVWDKRHEVEEETVKSLLFVMAGNMIKNYYKHRQVTFHFANSSNREEHAEAADFDIQQKEFEIKLQQVLSSMPENSRVVFLMNRMDNLTYNDIAQRLGLSVKAVEKRMHEALRILKDQIKHKI